MAFEPSLFLQLLTVGSPLMVTGELMGVDFKRGLRERSPYHFA